MASNLNLSNTSYTNKEFNDVYPELLEKAKELSYKWDPTVSNESDPGVTLIKEIALALDKINYSSDKNALETMPLSVTQERTARQLFQLLGYYPKWYISSEAKVSMAWKIDQDSDAYVEGEVVKLPAFTQIRDDSGDYVYTIPTDIFLSSDGTIEQVTAIQGPVKPLKINNSTLITLDLLDQNNRVYFPDYNVAQNGVYIISKDSQDSKQINTRSFWTQKDNLSIEEVGNTFYSFNVDISTNRCYIEFPSDISDLIGDGLYIYYLISAGRDGLVGIGQLNQLYDSSVTADYTMVQSGSIQMSSDNLYIQNTDLLVAGKDPESIASMYQNYNHIKGTFDTLVTLRDYNNAVYNTEEVSNAVVCDRTNDVQQSYRIMTATMDGSENVIYTQEADLTDAPYQNGKLEPFALKIYALQYNDLTNTESTSQNKNAYDNTFEMFEDLDVEDPLNIDSSLRQLVLLLNDDKCIQHDFSDIEPNKICLLKNVAEISLTVFPTIKLTSLQKENVTNSIRDQIYNLYNARMVNFGEEINYDDLFTNILTSNSLIKNISLNQIQYYTYALYYSTDEYDASLNPASPLTHQWREVCVSDENDYILCSVGSGTRKSGAGNGRIVHSATLASNGEDVKSLKKKNIYFIDQDTNYVYFLNQDNDVVLYSTKRDQFRKEILAKNILAGITPLFETVKNGFDYGANEANTQIDPAQTLDIVSTMPFVFNSSSTAKYYPKSNEVIQFVRPQLTSAVNYGAYVKYDYNGAEVTANSDHKLTADETLVLYYKTEDSDSSPYTRVIYGKISDVEYEQVIISPSFDLTPTTRFIQYLNDPTQVPSTALTTKSGQQIQIKKKNEVVLNSSTNYVYVIGEEYSGSDNVKNYRLKFELTPSYGGGYAYYTTTLQGEQQFIYASDQLTYLNIVGSGTKITIKTTDDYGEYFYISNPVVSTRNIQRYGVSALQGKWQKISSEVTILAQEFVNVVGTASQTPTDDDAWVQITSPISISSTIDLSRDGLSYGDGINSLRNGTAIGTANYIDDYGNTQIDNITPESNIIELFVTDSQYYNETSNHFVDNIELNPVPYLTEQITGVYENGNGPLTISGIKSAVWVKNYQHCYYLIDGSSLYISWEQNNGSYKVASIPGFPSAIPSTALTITKTGPVGNQYTYTSTSTLPAGKSIIVVKSTPVEEELDTQFYGVVQMNDGDQAQPISFESPDNLTFDEFHYSAYIVDHYYYIDSITLDYNNVAAGITYQTPVGAPASSSLQSNVDANGNPLQKITVQAHEAISGETIRFLLPTKLSNVFTYNNESSSSAATVVRNWEFINAKGLTKYISDYNERRCVFDYTSATYTDRTINRWKWPLSDFQINITAAKDAGTLTPSIYTYSYKNRGGEEESIQISSEYDAGWQIYGLAYIDSSSTQPSPLYDGQTLTINGQEYTSEDDYNTYVYSSQDLYIEGYKPQNLLFYDENEDADYPSLLVSRLPQDLSDYNYGLSDKSIIITKETGEQGTDDLVLEYTLPSLGSYIFTVKNYIDLQDFVFNVQPTSTSSEDYNPYFDIVCLQTDKQVSSSLWYAYMMQDKGVYQFYVRPTGYTTTDSVSDSLSSANLSLKFKLYIKSKTSTATTGMTDDQVDMLSNQRGVRVEISALRLVGYSDDSPITQADININDSSNLLAYIKEKAKYNGKDSFDYFYSPPEDKLIENPLVSTSFNNHNHFYNPYTICKIETYDSLNDSNIFINS